MLKEEIHQDKTPILNKYVPNNRASKFIKEMIKLKRETETYTTIIKDFMIFLFIIDSTSRQQVSTAIEYLNNQPTWPN